MQTTEAAPKRLTGMTGFVLVWLGQLISVLASSMSHFALSIWMFQETGSATAMALNQVFFITPFLIISPIAGVLIDRYNRKLMMMVSDLGAVLATGGILVLQAAGQLEVWHIYAAAVVYGIGNAFQWPAYTAVISIMVPKSQYGRANGLMSLVESGPGVFAPLLAGAALPLVGLTGILTFDVVTFFLAIGALLIVYIPQPKQSDEGRKSQGSMWKEAIYGFKYIFARPSLLGLVGMFFVANLFSGMGWAILAPLVLSRTGNNSVIFGTVESAAAIGGVAGALLMSAWGGPKRRIHGVLGGWIAGSLLGSVVFGLGDSLAVWIPSIILATLFGPIINGSSQAIWQAKVEPDIQGRVFTSRRLIAWFTQPVAPLIAGLLVDFLLEPAMMDTTSNLSARFSGWVGSDPGSGMSLLFIFCGLGSALTALVCYFIPVIRNVETIIPDHDQANL
jgi:MFS transporter, DHA3 family, macrolide efflux protein